MAGVMRVVMGLARLGAVIRFIPDPVIVGFTAGIAVIIWIGQWQYFFGLPAPGEGPFYLTTWELLQSFGQLHAATALLPASSPALAVFGPRIPGMSPVPGTLLAHVAATIGGTVFALPGVATRESNLRQILRARQT